MRRELDILWKIFLEEERVCWRYLGKKTIDLTVKEGLRCISHTVWLRLAMFFLLLEIRRNLS